MNPIEVLWCFEKNFIRKNTDGSFEKLLQLMEESKKLFIEQNINLRLWNRFFNTVNDYLDDASYECILKKYFGFKTQGFVQEHRKINSY